MIGRIAAWGAVAFSALLLMATFGWLAAERSWSKWDELSDRDAFIHGTIGLETFPLKYAAVMQRLSGGAFFPEGEDGNLWTDYGFIMPEDAPEATCVSNAAEWAPVGIGVSNYIQSKAFQTSTQFAGLTCAVCHSARLRLPDGSQTEVIHGLGNQELDVIAWGDGVKNAILDPALTTDAILAAYDDQCAAVDEANGLSEGMFQGLIDRIVITAWLGGIKGVIGDDLAKYGLPYDNADLRDAALIPAGPGRTRPFRSVVRVSLDLPGADNFALSKIPSVWEQREDLRPASQYDGSIKSPVTRSLIAAYASGASPLALSKPEIVHNIEAAARYTETLNLTGDAVPAFADVFDAPDPAAAERGLAVYMAECNGCHGHRPLDGGTWSLEGAGAVHRLVPLKGLGTDPERVTFRYAEMLPLALQTDFPGWGEDRELQIAALEDAAAKAQAERRGGEVAFWLRQLDKLNLKAREHRLGHPLHFPPGELTAEVGYFNNPIPRAWLRAPYLHNGSVPTMAQMIGLDPRPARFCRGANRYDPEAMGYAAANPDDGPCPAETPFVYDTGAKGNSAAGHYYPRWAFAGGHPAPGADRAKLTDLLAYLKGL